MYILGPADLDIEVLAGASVWAFNMPSSELMGYNDIDDLSCQKIKNII